ncbi:hypothetical protein KQX54_006552 [Cotesia glomerata]|uniref:Uncharacterized protein n=1 Tax=Cotesia glomerata TaxID=32391 RepID=A0AAV7HD73_COTGL|nr:hypothetical protein KQX54_006552 [Cotesia glomerata]
MQSCVKMFKIQELKTKTVLLFIILIVLVIYCNAHPQPQTSNDIHKNDNIEQKVEGETDKNPENTNLVQKLTSTEELPLLVSLMQHLVPKVHFTIITIFYNFFVKVFKHIRDAHNDE